MTFRAQVLSGIRWTAGARFAAQLGTWAITLIVIRILSPEDYGLLAMATMFITLLSMFGEFGLGSALVQRADTDDATLQRVFGVVLVIHVSMAALLVLCAPLIAAFFSEPRVVVLVQVLSAQFVVAAFVVVPDALLQRAMKFKGRSLIELVAVMVGSAATLVLAMKGAGVWALVTGTLVAQLLKAIGLNVIMPCLRPPIFALHELRPLLRFGGSVTLSNAMWIVFSQCDALICGRLLGKETLGVYSVAMHLASLPIQRISGIVNQVAFPAFARLQADLPRIGVNVLRGTRILTFFAVPVLWGVSSIAPELVEVVLGAKWQLVALPLQVLGLVMPLRTLSYFLPNAVQAVGRTDILLVNAVWAFALGVPALWMGASGWGLVGLCVAWLAFSPLLFLRNTMSTLPALGLRFGEFAAAVGPAAVSGIVMYLAVIGARNWLFVGESGVMRLAMLIVIGAAAYLVASWLLNRKGVDEVLALLRGLVPWSRVG